MANRYVWQSGTGASPTTGWAGAHATMAAAITAGAAGDVYYVAHDYVEVFGANTTLTFKGTFAAPDRILCVNRAGTVPPVAADLMTGAALSTSAAFTLTMTGVYYCYGLSMTIGANSSNTALYISGAEQNYEACHFALGSTSAAARINASAGDTRLSWVNCTAAFGNVGQSIVPGTVFRWVNKPGSTAVTGATIPSPLITMGTAAGGAVLLSGLDLSALGAGKTIVSLGSASPGLVRLVNCKLHASVTPSSVGVTSPSAVCELIGCNSAAIAARNERYMSRGTLTTETTIVRTGGASDGVTPYSWKIVPDADNERDFPFETFEGVLWNTAVGSPKTLKVEIVTDNVTLTDAEIWLEVDYLGSSATPVSSFISDAPATVLTAAANQASSSVAWTTTGLTTPLKQKLEVTFTPQMVGPIRWLVKYAKASTTVYVCPKAELS